jgi:lycopene beta-cyclase
MLHPTPRAACAGLLMLLLLDRASCFQFQSLVRTVPIMQRSGQPKIFMAVDSGTLGSSTTTNDNNDKDDVLDVMICGAGPGGLLLASQLSQRGCKVGIVDPVLDKAWPNNYGVWMDEADFYGYVDCVRPVWKEVGIVFDEDHETILKRPYGRVDRIALKGRLIQECEATGNVQFLVAKATEVKHFDDQPSIVETISSTGVKKTIQALMVADATGFARKFVKHDTKFDPGFQVTYGALYRVKDLGPYTLDRMVLMDYSERHLHPYPELRANNDRFPSFVYIMPLAKDKIFLEETVLVSRPGASSKDLQARLEQRMKAMGIEPLEILEDERAAIPMGGMDPVVPQRTLGFGATSSLIHPASGYMVARAMEIAPRVADTLAPKLKTLRAQYHSATSGRLDKGQLDDLAAQGWNAVWPTDDRRQRDFMHFGFELLCLLNPQELRDFFTGFFRLPNGLWEHFLSWRLSGIGHVVMGLQVWAQCIPKRFMPAMLIKSIPFIPNRLVGPFLTRGNLAPIDTRSVYADGRSGNSTLWEPSQYYPYLATLTQTDYPKPGEEEVLTTATADPAIPQAPIQDKIEASKV